MIKWGISAYNHNAALAVVDGDEILFASEAERYSGIKNDANLPDELIEAALEYGEPWQINWYESNLLKNLRYIILSEYKSHVLKKFSKKSYIGYTATPFANIFIDIDDEDEMAEVEQFVTACYDGRHSTSHTIEKVSNHF